MPRVDFDLKRVEGEILEVLHVTLSGLPAECVSLAVKRPPETTHAIRFEITPSSPLAARMAVHLYDDLPNVNFEPGEDAVIELSPKGAWYTDLPFREELRLLCSSVVAGDFEETLWLVGNHVFKSRARIRVQEKWHTFYFRHSFHPFRRSRIVHKSYLPYCAD